MGGAASTITDDDLRILRRDLRSEISTVKRYMNDVTVDLTQNQSNDKDLAKTVLIMSERIGALERRFDRLADKVDTVAQIADYNRKEIGRVEKETRGRLATLRS